ncbi:MAG: DUF2318 domain-containing protein [Clostridiales bacterium]|nr:DUF2318 domain-containing protein [Clostridiales bacterium]
MKTKNKNIILPIVTVLVVIVAVLAIVVPKISGDSTDIVDSETVQESTQSEADTPVFTSDIEIEKSEITETATFYDYDADGTIVELFAVKASDGSIRLALNTCQVCMGSPYAYFLQSGDSFICQNCKNSFDTDDVGIEQGGCNPVPITEDNYTESDGIITVSSDFLEEYKEEFSGWKSF